MYFDGRRYAWHRKPGFEYLLLDTEECQGAGGCGEQVGLGEGQDCEGDEDFRRCYPQPFRSVVDFPIIFASALTKQRILKVLEEARDVYENRMTRIPTARLNEEMLPLIEAYPPPSIKGKYIKIKYITQLPNTQVPSFVYFANLPQYVKEPYRRFLENKMREKWKLTGTPINIYIRQK